MINPGGNSIDTPIKLGQGKTIERHNYYSIDTGTKHQWSVYRSNQSITFVDVRHKKVYLFDGQQLNPISDTQGNRNIVVKLLHDNVLTLDNPITGNGILKCIAVCKIASCVGNVCNSGTGIPFIMVRKKGFPPFLQEH
jgi:hypothetical protein